MSVCISILYDIWTLMIFATSPTTITWNFPSFHELVIKTYIVFTHMIINIKYACSSLRFRFSFFIAAFFTFFACSAPFGYFAKSPHPNLSEIWQLEKIKYFFISYFRNLSYVDFLHFSTLRRGRTASLLVWRWLSRSTVWFSHYYSTWMQVLIDKVELELPFQL